MKKTRVAILFLLLTLFAACLPAAAELPAQITKPCQNKDRIHNLIGYFAFGNRHCGLYKCTHCGREGVYYSPYEDHSGGTETPTCTTGKTCALCGAEYGILGHDWDAWTSNGDGTHTRRCTVDGCTGSETKDCSGGTATCTEKAKCSVCGAEYGDLNPAHHANLVNVPAKAATTSAEGNIEYWHCGGCGKYYKDAAAQEEIKQEDTVIAKRRVYYAPSLYPVRNGTNPPSGTEYSGGVYGLIFRAAVSGITGVQVDGRTVGRGSYTVEGSYPVELYLKASYLNRLAKGGHTLTVLTDSGSLTAAFTVGSGKSSPTTFDAGITVYAAAAVTSLTGLELLRRRRKEEE